MINVEDLRDYCLSLGDDIEEKMPFGRFPGAGSVLAFYVCGHMFCYFDIEEMTIATVKCQPERIIELRASHDCITNPYNASPKHWIGIKIQDCDPALMQSLIANSYKIVKEKWSVTRHKNVPS